jgi:L-lysine 2,3-aminomutase
MQPTVNSSKQQQTAANNSKQQQTTANNSNSNLKKNYTDPVLFLTRSPCIVHCKQTSHPVPTTL